MFRPEGLQGGLAARTMVVRFESGSLRSMTLVILESDFGTSASGRDGGRARDLATHSIIVPSDQTPHIQEMHIMIAHILCDLIDQHFA